VPFLVAGAPLVDDACQDRALLRRDAWAEHQPRAGRVA
jgi:hypothetical protein